MACYHTCRSGENVGTICSVLAASPPEGFLVFFPSCVYHLEGEDCKKYAEEVQKVLEENSETVCEICHENLLAIPVENLFKSNCCKKFFCRDCVKSQLSDKKVRYHCSMCREPTVLDRHDLDYMNHSTTAKAFRKVYEAKLLGRKDAIPKVMESLRESFEALFIEKQKELETKALQLTNLLKALKLVEGSPNAKKAIEDAADEISDDLHKPMEVKLTFPQTIIAFVKNR